MSAVVIRESIANMEKCLGKAGCSLKCLALMALFVGIGYRAAP